ILLAGGLWFWVFVIGCAFALLTLITALVYEPDREAKDATGLLDLLALLFMATLPMYLIGEDWGRWIMIVSMSYLLLLFTVSPRRVPALGLTGRMSRLISKVVAHRRTVVCFALFFCLTFSYPEWGYFPGQSSNPLAFIFTASQRLFHSVTPGAAWVDTSHFDDGHRK